MAGDGGLPEGVCIPRTPGRTFGPCSAGRLAAGGHPSLPGAPGVLFPINVLFTVTWYQDFPPVSSAAFPGGVRLTLVRQAQQIQGLQDILPLTRTFSQPSMTSMV